MGKVRGSFSPIANATEPLLVPQAGEDKLCGTAPETGEGHSIEWQKIDILRPVDLIDLRADFHKAEALREGQ